MSDTYGRVLLRGDHPWSGEMGEVIDFDNIGMKVRLLSGNVGHEVYAFEGQWKRLTHA